MRRFLSLLLVFLLTLGTAAGVAARTTEPFSAAKAPLDLAAMQLRPSDLKGARAFYCCGQQITLSDVPDSTQRPLEDAHFQFGHTSTLLMGGSNRFVSSTIYAFAGPKSATAGYRTLLKLYTSDETEIEGQKTVGAQSEVTRGSQTNTDGSVTRQVNILVRSGQMVVQVGLGDPAGVTPPASEVVRLSGILVKRITAVQDGKSPAPGLSQRVLRFTGPKQSTFADGYLRLDGTDVSGAPASKAAEEAKIFAGATDIYREVQVTSSLRFSDVPSADWHLIDFRDKQSASHWIANQIPLEEQGSKRIRVTSLSKKTRYGDETRLATYHYERGGQTLYGAEIDARYGKSGLSLTIEATRPVDASVAEGLMKKAESCFKATGCAPVPVPSALLELADHGAAPAAVVGARSAVRQEE